jgi:hypothetical protein
MNSLPGRENLHYLKEWFAEFTETADSDDDALCRNFDIKREHTRRVTEEIVTLGTRLGLTEEELILAEIIALLHDTGRFQQYRRYNTFSDAKSENHAELGIRIIEKQDLLKDIDPAAGQLIKCSIRYHNRPSLPADESASCLFWSKLIRDADKLDILRVITGYYHRADQEQNVALELELPDTPGISEAVYSSLMRQEIVNIRDVRNLNDIKLLQAGWVYDINFIPALEEIAKRNYTCLLKSALPAMPEVEEIFDAVSSFIDNRLQSEITTQMA